MAGGANPLIEVLQGSTGFYGVLRGSQILEVQR
jgi:hypothetical protein